MNPLEKYCEYLDTQDIDALENLFADEFLFDDRGGQDLGRPPFIRTDKKEYREAMLAAFKATKVWKVRCLGTAYGNIVYYDVERDGLVLPCVGICRTDADGKITEYKVFVREVP